MTFFVSLFLFFFHFAMADSYVQSLDLIQTKKVHYLVVLPSDQISQKRPIYEKYFSTKKIEAFSFLQTDPDRLSELSTGDIVKSIRESKGSVLLVSEGKSAADCLEALILYPGLQAKVSGFVSFDGHIQGAKKSEKAKAPLQSVSTQKAQKVPLILAMRALVDFFVEVVSGFDPTLYSFKPEVRRHYLKERDQQIQKLSRNVSLFSFDQGPSGYGYIPHSRVLNSRVLK